MKGIIDRQAGQNQVGDEEEEEVMAVWDMEGWGRLRRDISQARLVQGGQVVLGV
jgi:hypothetical protein